MLTSLVLLVVLPDRDQPPIIRFVIAEALSSQRLEVHAHTIDAHFGATELAADAVCALVGTVAGDDVDGISGDERAGDRGRDDGLV